MAKKVYALRKMKETGEFHLFECIPKLDGKCSCNKKSICQKMDNSDSEKTIFACKAEDYTRIRSAKTGRKVCGTCVSHLYETYK